MNTGGDAADQVVRMSLEGSEVALKISGEAAKEFSGDFPKAGEYELLSEENVEEMFSKEGAEKAAQKEEVSVQP